MIEPPLAHTQRIDDLVSRIGETAQRLAARIDGAGEHATRASTGWSAAQIGAHVALVNDSLAQVLEGTVPGAVPAAPDFQERAWSDIVSAVPARNQAPARFVPPADVSGAEAASRVRESAAHVAEALRALTPERAAYCFTNRLLGTLSLYQAGEFAIAHMIRHNQQAKRVLGG